MSAIAFYRHLGVLLVTAATGLNRGCGSAEVSALALVRGDPQSGLSVNCAGAGTCELHASSFGARRHPRFGNVAGAARMYICRFRAGGVERISCDARKVLRLHHKWLTLRSSVRIYRDRLLIYLCMQLQRSPVLLRIRILSRPPQRPYKTLAMSPASPPSALNTLAAAAAATSSQSSSALRRLDQIKRTLATIPAPANNNTMDSAPRKHRVTVIGSGNW